MGRDSMKECRCGCRIPAEWRTCASCRAREESDVYVGDFQQRMERAQLVRVRRGMEFEVIPVLDGDEQQALLDGIARVSQQNHILDTRKRMHSWKHIEALYRNARAANLDTIDKDMLGD